MRSETIKITGQADFLIVNAVMLSSDGTMFSSQEKLTFDRKASQATAVVRPRVTSTAKW